MSSLLPSSSLPMPLTLFSRLLSLLFLLVIAYPWPFVIVSLLADEVDVNDGDDFDKNVVMMLANVLFSLLMLQCNGLDNISSLIRPIAADEIAAKITM